MFNFRRRPDVLVIKSGYPQDFDVAQVEEFIKHNTTLYGDSLQQRLDRCLRIVCLGSPKCDEIFGTAAIKQPFLSYRKKIFADIQNDEVDKFPLELGYVVVAKKYRGMGIGVNLVDEAMYNIDEGVFATVEKTNLRMKRILTNRYFVEQGIPYRSYLDDTKDMNVFLLKKVMEQ